ncbi:adenylosuccinate lyase [Fervidobacterium pennivorans subsp. shakshaketiis]|jgi:adenylosuccinate lyase|uniref:Adenylosuccinate lyase n=1 Tax=Fervidobacterium pennivorans (strain DSM 9078 / Ven5) TaxID=771875 RepID=H9UEU3_FERPD|nr:adenylosuccinate lyase [Fervidobacterium pennivorans]AFG36036.1 adenylosuccinate lyase [Fervidobacterium pennivorans DSM 9078]QIV79090.1 adenylosuccinate lyase [Fervidobacterium pennivorans subsp. keratinolyticus]
MVERYALEPLKSLWTLKAQYERWLEVELAVVEAYEQVGIAPKGTAEEIRKKAFIDVDDILATEQVVDHDVIAFIKSVTKNMGDEARYFHYGLTSSDVVDTANSLVLIRATDIILESMEKLRLVLYEKALQYKTLPTIGRTHGVHAEPTSFGLKFLSWYAELLRDIERLKRVREEIAVGKLSGAVGNYANISPEVEKIALEKLGLKPTPVATQVISRDYIAHLLATFAIIAGLIERIAIEIRHLQRTEVLEAMEPFKEGQRGSSAMPHKKNPILCERLTGMARLMRSYAQVAFENMALWHERDISHSSAERYILPDSTMTIYYMLEKARYLIENLRVFEEKVKKNIDITQGLVYSQRILLALVEAGMSREEAYTLVQKYALECWETGESFKERLRSDEKISQLITEEKFEELFKPDYYLKNIDKIYERFEKK